MFFYVSYLFLISIIILILNNIKIKKIRLIQSTILFLSLFIVIGMRDVSIGNDTISYVYFYENLNLDYLQGVFNIYYEKGYILLNIIVKFFSSIPQSIIFVTAFLESILITLFLKNNSKNLAFSFYLFVTLLFLMDSMNIIRQVIAVFISINGFKYIKKREFIKYFICIMIAISFHKTAIIMLPMYWIYGVKFNIKRTLNISFVGILIFLFINRFFNIISIFMNQYSTYQDRIGSNKLASVMAFLISLTIFTWGIICNLKLKKIDEENKDYNKVNDYLNYIILIALIINFLSIKMNILGRFNLYFEIYYLIYIPNNIFFIKNRKLKIIMVYIVSILTLLYFITIMTLRPEWYNSIPYVFYR